MSEAEQLRRFGFKTKFCTKQLMTINKIVRIGFLSSSPTSPYLNFKRQITISKIMKTFLRQIMRNRRIYLTDKTVQEISAGEILHITI